MRVDWKTSIGLMCFLTVMVVGNTAPVKRRTKQKQALISSETEEDVMSLLIWDIVVTEKGYMAMEKFTSHLTKKGKRKIQAMKRQMIKR